MAEERNIDYYLRNYSLNDVELASLKKFKNHRCSSRYMGQVNRCITVAFTGTSMGTAVKVSCHCGKSKNITDYASW